MDNELKTYLLDLIISRYNNPIEALLLNVDDIVSANVTTAVSGNANTKLKLKLSNGQVREFTYNRQSLTEAINATVGFDGFELSEFTAETVSDFLTENGLTLSSSDLVVTKLGDTAAKIEASNSNVRYYGSINVTSESTGTVPSNLLQLEIDIPASVADIPALDAVTDESLQWVRTVDHVGKTITLVASGDISPAAEAVPIPMYIGDSSFANALNQLKVSAPSQIVAKFAVGQNTAQFNAQQLIDTMNYDATLNRYYSTEALKSIYAPNVQLSLDNFVTQTSYTLIIDISNLT